MIWATSRECVLGLQRAIFPAQGWPKGSFCTEIEAPRGRRVVKTRRGRYRTRKTGPRRRADVIWAPANKGELHGYEIKVTRGDLLRELAEPEKTAQWQQYCHSWTLLVGDPSIVLGLEDRIPATWGIVSPPSGRAIKALTVHRTAPIDEPLAQDTGPAWSRVSAWQAWKIYQLGLQLEAEHELPELYEWEPDMEEWADE